MDGNFLKKGFLSGFWKRIGPFYGRILNRYLAKEPFRIGIFGLKGAGKTTYIARYYQYLRDQMDEEWNATCEDQESNQYLQGILKSISRGEVCETRIPQPLRIITSCQKDGWRRLFRIHTYDIPGGNLETLQGICDDLGNCHGLVFLIDPMGINPTTLEACERMLLQLSSNGTPPPMAFIFSKLDHPEAPEDLRRDLWGNMELQEGDSFSKRSQYFARQKLPGCYKLVLQSFDVEFFSLTSFGDWMETTSSSGEQVVVPDPDKPPLGLHLPMEWLYKKIWEKRKRRFLLFFCLGMAIFLGGLLFFLLGYLITSS